jgi:hypothetical protein
VNSPSEKPKPTLYLLGPGKHDDLDELIQFFKNVTGREPTSEEIEGAIRDLDEV